jgi:hypothetical protein
MKRNDGSWLMEEVLGLSKNIPYQLDEECSDTLLPTHNPAIHYCRQVWTRIGPVQEALEVYMEQ